MRNISYYILGTVLLGMSIVSFWIYQKYFQKDEQTPISFEVVRGDIREAVNVRGEVVSQKEFMLEFPFGGTVEKVFVKEGAFVKAGDPLMKLETTELDTEYGRVGAVLLEQEASLAKLLSGAQVEEIQVSETKVSGASQGVSDSNQTLIDSVRGAFTLADDAVHNKADLFFDNPRTASPKFKQEITDTQLKITLEAERSLVESALVKWGATLPGEKDQAVLLAESTQQYLSQIKTFFLSLANAINSITPTGSITQTTLDTWKASILSARTTVDTVIASVTTSQEKLRTAQSALALAESELALRKSKPQSEDIAIAEARIDQTKHALEALREKIKKSTLRAPGSGVVKKIMLEEQEIFKPGVTALFFSSAGYKLQADVSELDISKVREVGGNEAQIKFDALSGKVFKGEVVSIEPKEVVKNDDIYFRTEIFLNSEEVADIRSGMSADVVLYGEEKKGALIVPALVIEKDGEKAFVRVAPGASSKDAIDLNNLTEQEVTLGISDGEFVEILTGLNEGDFVVIASE